jgi:hypothetical protein
LFADGADAVVIQGAIAHRAHVLAVLDRTLQALPVNDVLQHVAPIIAAIG